MTSWRQAGFDEVIQSRGSGASALPQSEWASRGKYPVIGQGAEYIEGWTDREDLVVTPHPALVLYGGHTRRAKLVDRPFVPGPNVKILEPAPDLNAAFLFRYLEQLNIESRGYADHFPEVRRRRIPVPPLAEQLRIAAILDKADVLCVKRRNAIAQLETIVQSIFLDMFGDPATNPKGFQRTRLDALVREGDSINYGVVQPGDDCEEGVPLIRVGDLQNGKVEQSALKRISPSIESAYRRSRLRGDEILVSCVGSTGVVALADESLKGFNIARAVARIPLADSIDRAFMASYLRTEFVQRYFKNELRTVSQPTLNIKQISEAIVVLPPPGLQHQFARCAAAVKRIDEQQRESLKQSAAVFASIQQQAFRGAL